MLLGDTESRTVIAVSFIAEGAASRYVEFRILGPLQVVRDSRPADALHAYQRLRVALKEELGRDPSTPLRKLHADILANDPGLSAPPVAAQVIGVAKRPIPAHLRPDVTGYIGRCEQLGRLDTLVDSQSRTVVIAVVTGTAGVGKTDTGL